MHESDYQKWLDDYYKELTKVVENDDRADFMGDTADLTVVTPRKVSESQFPVTRKSPWSFE